jgi:hypothetical protein
MANNVYISINGVYIDASIRGMANEGISFSRYVGVGLALAM